MYTLYRSSCVDVKGICRGAPPYWQQQWPSDYLHTSRGTALVYPRFWPCKLVQCCRLQSSRHALSLCCCLQQTPTFDVTTHPCWKASDRIAGYITVVILPAHLPSPERIDAVTWTLLTLPAHLDFTTKAFKVWCCQTKASQVWYTAASPCCDQGCSFLKKPERGLASSPKTNGRRPAGATELAGVCVAKCTMVAQASLHEHLRGTYEELLGQLQSARCDSVEGGSRQGHRAVAVPARAPTPVGGSLLDRIRAKAHAAPVRDMGSMLNRHKENVHAN